MNKILLFLACLLLTSNLLAQENEEKRNVIKGRIFAFPIPTVLSLGIGYERVFENNTSVQLLLNRLGYDNRGFDGTGHYTNYIVPEYRIYFAKNKDIDKAFFLGVFNGFGFGKIHQSGEDPDEILQLTRRFSLNPGILLGKNFALKKNKFIDIYIGGKYRYIKQTKDYDDNGVLYTTKQTLQGFGARIGINLGKRF